MRSFTALKVFYFFTFCVFSISSLNSDGLSLLALKAAISKDPTQSLISWSDLDSAPCKWVGVTCDNTHSVTSISLSGKNLSGYIPSEIGALSYLTYLDLSDNLFSGNLPHDTGTLKNLIHLDVSSNHFNGSLLENLNNLTRLTGTLNLSNNEFSGEIPASFGLFPVMLSLDLRNNNLTGKVPQVGSLLNQGPTAFSGNPYLCGFPVNSPCAEPEAQNPKLLNDPQKPVNAGISENGFVENRKNRSGPVIVSVISGLCLIAGIVLVSVLVIKRKWQMQEGKTAKFQDVSLEVVGVGKGMGSEEGQQSKFVVVDEGFGLELEDLLRASAYVVGKSRSGIVYKVVVGGSGKTSLGGPVVVAVRRLSEGDARWRFKEFEAEVEAIGRVQHSNIVRLRAYYYASDEKLLISDFMCNGSLYDALHGGSMNTLPPLSWAARLGIIQETAKGLMHIHDCSPRRYIHGTIRSSKILLDKDLKPHISGFGLSRLVQGTSTSTIVSPKRSSSTISYTAPEARVGTSRLTQRCDVYSFGVVILEILTGRLPDDSDGNVLEGFVRKVFREGRPLMEIIDPALMHEVHSKKQVVATFHIALNCTELDPELRPRMRTIVDNLDSINLL